MFLEKDVRVFSGHFFSEVYLQILKKYIPLHSLTRELVTCFNIVLWCNGSTTDSGPVSPGSNPGRTTCKVYLTILWRLFYGVMVAQQILVLFVQVRILVEQQESLVIR